MRPHRKLWKIWVNQRCEVKVRNSGVGQPLIDAISALLDIMAPKIAPKRRERKPYHKKDLAAQIDDPAAHGVRVCIF